MRKISIGIPVYYNAESLPLLFEELVVIEKQLQEKELELELIFIDDGSGDDSFRQLMKIKEQRENTRIIKLTRNFGAIHAVKAALSYISGDCFGFLSADLQDPPELILEMADKWLQGSKFVLCTRQARHDPILSKVCANMYYRILRLFVVPNYPAGGFDLALMDRSVLPYLQESGKNINLALFSYWLGFEPEIIYYTRRKRPYGKSRWTFSKKITLFLDSILGFSVLPIRLISLTGMLVSMASFVYGMLVVIFALLGNTDVPGYPSIVSLISFLLGLVIVMLGVIGEYIWRIFDEINRRPESVIDEVY
ncbi:MAG: glycosyltransferase [Syntrophomonas sp.]